MSCLINLPQDVFVIILTLLPLLSRLAFGCSSKKFYRWYLVYFSCLPRPRLLSSDPRPVDYAGRRISLSTAITELFRERYESQLLWLQSLRYPVFGLPSTIPLENRWQQCAHSTRGCRCDFESPYYLTECIREAARGGWLKMVQRLINQAEKERWLHPRNNASLCVESVCAAAVEGGNILLLSWLLAKGYRFPSWAFGYVTQNPIAVLQWALENQISIQSYYSYSRPPLVEREAELYCSTGSVWTQAAGAGRLQVFEWLASNNIADWRDVSLCAYAAAGGHLRLLQWLREKNSPWDGETLLQAAQFSRLEVLEWCLQNGCALVASAVQSAATNGNVRVLRMLLDHKCPVNARAAEEAAAGNHIVALQFLRSQDAPWDNKTISRAAREGHLEIVRWALENGCPRTLCISRKLLQEAIRYEDKRPHQIAIVRLLIENGYRCRPSPAGVCWFAAYAGLLPLLKSLRSSGCPLSRKATYAAASRGHRSVLEWLLQNGSPYKRARLVEVAHSELRAWLCEYLHHEQQKKKTKQQRTE